ncbi:XRE family transcriptional regulator [Cytobacillus praedii]|uniref:XRE family transcriptional regulator n=2 Tax=Cytobacillus praedii TaxID=1742358 RepID=A0A4R1AT57_9BACI|nr:XRE family transcriptional regulator [Cytobacillus praedii]
MIKSFGEELKRLRTRAKIGSRELSRMIPNKGEAYVSQIESGRIKNVDYNTAFMLLKNIGVTEVNIEKMLKHYGIIDPFVEKELLNRQIEQMELHEHRMKNDNDYADRYLANQIEEAKIHEELTENGDDFTDNKLVNQIEEQYQLKKESLEDRNKQIFEFFNSLIKHNVDKANEVINNMFDLINTDFNFFLKLMEIDYQSISKEEKERLVQLIRAREDGKDGRFSS